MAMSVEDRQRLSDQIRDWNACRLELFEISQPDPNGEFYGVIRFFFQEAGEKVATKCIRISNAMTNREIITMLVEKFRPDMRMLTTGTYALYEVHFSEERKLADHERPLLVQLSWSKGDREGRFLLKNENDAQQPPKEEMKRKLSKREKKEAKKAPVNTGPAGPTEGKENKPRVAEMLYKEVPETSFTRSISNPEAVMRRRRQQKLEKLQQVQRQEGGARGNIIKIFGEMIDPSIPYKTVLLSRQDTAANVVRDMLVKYGREHENPNNYCLLLVQLQPTSAGQELQRVECILQDSDSPLVVAQQLQPEYIRFEICPRNRLPPGPNNAPQSPVPQQQPQQQQPLLQMLPQAGTLPGQQPLQRSLSADLLSRQNAAEMPQRFPYLKEMSPDGRDLPNGKAFILDAEVTDVGRMPRLANNRNIQLMSVGVQPQHCVIARMDGIVTVTPFSNEADTYVDNRRIHETTMLEHGAIVRFGRQAVFRFIDPACEQPKPSSGPRPPPGAVRVLPPSVTAEIPQRSMSPILMPGQAQPLMTQSASQLLPAMGQTQFQQPLLTIGSDRLDELPASLIVSDPSEDRFLGYVVLDSQSTNSQFRLAPAFSLYMVARFRLTNRYQPQPPIYWQEKPQKIMVFLEKVASTIRRAIHAKPADVGYLAFWLANSSELLNFLRCDLDLAPLSESSRAVLGEAVQMSFHYLINAVHLELNKSVLPSFFAENDDDLRIDQDAVSRRNASTSSLASSGASDVVQLLTVVMSLSRRCRINAGLTIQLFSHWFHFINHRIFNTLIQSAPRYCTRAWGSRLLRRLNAVHGWAEKNGLELAVDTHLERARQATVLLEAAKDSPAQAGNIAARIFRLNSMQVKALLDGCARAVAQGLDTAHLSRQFVETLLTAARQTADEALRAAGFDVVLYEREDLNSRFLMPDDGYASDVTKDIPPGLQDFLQPVIRDGVCGLNLHQGVTGSWVVYFSKKGAFLDRPPSELQQQPMQMQTAVNPSYASQATPNRMSVHLEQQHPPHSPSYQMPAEPPQITVQLQKVGNSLGLSIVAARGEVNKLRGIYVKSVVPNGAAYLDGRIKEGDQLVEVDGRSLQGLSQESAAEMLVSTGQIVSLLVAKQAAMYHGVAMLLGQANLPNQPLPYTPNGGTGGVPMSPTQIQPIETIPQQQYARPEYARPRSHNEELKPQPVPTTPQQQMANLMTQSFSGAFPTQPQPQVQLAQPLQIPIQKMPVQQTNDQQHFIAPSYENWSQAQVVQAMGAFNNQPAQPQLAKIASTSVPNLLQPAQPQPPSQPAPQILKAPFRELLPPSLATRVTANEANQIMPKVDVEPERLQPSFYVNTTQLPEQHPHFERMAFQIDEQSEQLEAELYQPPNPERRMLVPLPQIPLVEVKAKEFQPDFFRALRPPVQSPSRPSDSNYMHLSDLASSGGGRTRTSSGSGGGAPVGPLLQQPPVRQPTSLSTSSTFTTTIGRPFEQPPASQPPPPPLSEPRRLIGGDKESPQQQQPLLLNSASRRKDELAELESRSILTQPELERLRQLRIGNGTSEPQRPSLVTAVPATTTNNEPINERDRTPVITEDLENRRTSLQTQNYHRDPEAERRREEEIEQMRVEKAMERVNLRKQQGLPSSPTPPTTTVSARFVTSTYTSSSSSIQPPAPISALAGGILSGSYVMSSPGSSPKMPPKLNVVAKPVPPPVAPKPLSGPRPYKPSVAPKPGPAPMAWRSPPSPSPPPLPSSPPPSDLPDEFDRRQASPPSGVIGKGEVYRDPRDRILQERAYYDQQELIPPPSGSAPPSASRLTFHDKMRLFAHEAGEGTPKDRVRASRTQMQIEAKLQTH